MRKSVLSLFSLIVLTTLLSSCDGPSTAEKLAAPSMTPTFTAKAVTPATTPTKQPAPTTTFTVLMPSTPALSPLPATLPPSPTVEQTSLPEPTELAVETPFQEFGIDYCGPDLAACAALGATWSRHSGISTLADAQAALDLAQSLNMVLLLRLSSGDWGWNDERFDLTPLREFESIFDHPAMLGFYGLHEPWERFDADELRLFYQQFHQVVAGHNLLLWHDLGHIRSTFTDGICDLCGVSVNPHTWDQSGEPVNDWERTTRKLDEALQYMDGTLATLCAGPQVYGRDFSSEMRARVRMPTPEEYIENLRLVVETYDVRCITNYAYTHRSYDHVLGDADQDPLREAVHQMGERYFGP